MVMFGYSQLLLVMFGYSQLLHGNV